MNQRQTIVAGGIVGAVAGMAASYLLFTPNGQRWRRDAERSLGSFIQEAERLLSAADQVRQSVADLRGGQTGWPRSA
ncbi:MAG TPA: YtxH domain-containing protein [Vicinamibacterales bacterium]|nr:YtxH domain-containing protein [Vicinamibacterales bacterium]